MPFSLVILSNYHYNHGLGLSHILSVFTVLSATSVSNMIVHRPGLSSILFLVLFLLLTCLC